MPIGQILFSLLNILLSSGAIGGITYLESNDWKAGIIAGLGSLVQHVRGEPSITARNTR